MKKDAVSEGVWEQGFWRGMLECKECAVSRDEKEGQLPGRYIGNYYLLASLVQFWVRASCALHILG